MDERLVSGYIMKVCVEIDSKNQRIILVDFVCLKCEYLA